jgi:hypothetical protein
MSSYQTDKRHEVSGSWQAARPTQTDLPSPSVARLNWEEAAKRDYVAKHGSVPFWPELGSGSETRAEKQEVALRARLQAHTAIVQEYAELAPFERQNRYMVYRRRLCDGVDAERRRLRSRDPRFARAIDEYENGLLSMLADLRPRPPGF